VFDDRRLGGGAAHVEGDHVVNTQLTRQSDRGDHAGRRTGLDDIGRFQRRGGVRHHSAVGLHDQQWRGHAARVELAPQRMDVVGHQRLDVGVDDGRAGPLVLADDRQNFVRQRYGHVRPAPPQHLADGLLVGRVGVGVQQRDGDGLHAVGYQVFGGVLGLGQVERE
jgi:hypothetical protein